ncbi:ras-specific guanine nucleotide-releasing factor RalGPS2 [Trichonephila clavata]|uniref:Ras-specific guanine nucleotide-releasing factor RalGPS2 n=1 Tax=Trichonephila clavata TaxID=2740835 RepID=A0A8X6GHR3_TRICU|nr:ras-specific guanine nucleotide-releasing factor RalGPS2 [Trichonephila clavata]
MAQKSWYWLKRKLFSVPRVRVPTAAFFTDVEATVYAEQLTLLEGESFGCSDISELRIPFLKCEQSPDRVTFKHLSEWTVYTIHAQFCPKRRVQIVSHFIEIANALHQMRNVHSEVAIISALSSAPIERPKGLVSLRAVGEFLVPVTTRRTWAL